MHRRSLSLLMIFALLFTARAAVAADPADYLKGRVIISDKPMPMRWTSVGSFVSTLKSQNKATIWYDKKTHKAQIYYAAFFSKPIDDVQVNLVIYDVTNNQHIKKESTESFMQKGERANFNNIQMDEEDFEDNKKYMLSIEHRGRTLATGTVILRTEGPHYSGKVTFTDDETKDKK